MAAYKWTKMQRETKKQEALELSYSGQSFSSIAKTLGCSKSSVHDLIQDANDTYRPHADFDAYRANQIAKIEFTLKGVMRGLSEQQGKKAIDPYKYRCFTESLTSLLGELSKLTDLHNAPFDYQQIYSMSDEELDEKLKEIWENRFG